MLKLFHTDLRTRRVDEEIRVLGTNVELYFKLSRLRYNPRRTEQDPAATSSETGPAASAVQRDRADVYPVDDPPPRADRAAAVLQCAETIGAAFRKPKNRKSHNARMSRGPPSVGQDTSSTAAGQTAPATESSTTITSAPEASKESRIFFGFSAASTSETGTVADAATLPPPRDIRKFKLQNKRYVPKEGAATFEAGTTYNAQHASTAFFPHADASHDASRWMTGGPGAGQGQTAPTVGPVILDPRQESSTLDTVDIGHPPEPTDRTEPSPGDDLQQCQQWRERAVQLWCESWVSVAEQQRFDRIQTTKNPASRTQTVAGAEAATPSTPEARDRRMKIHNKSVAKEGAASTSSAGTTSAPKREPTAGTQSESAAASSPGDKRIATGRKERSLYFIP